MNSSNPHPKWWQLYLIFLLLIVLFLMDHRLKISTRGHEVAQLGIILAVYGLIYGWVKANSRAISRMDQEQYYRTVRVIQIPPLQLPEVNEKRRSILQLPSTEVNGILSDTFDMETTDFLAIDSASKEVNKE